MPVLPSKFERSDHIMLEPFAEVHRLENGSGRAGLDLAGGAL
jgi:hypothetical protein